MKIEPIIFAEESLEKAFLDIKEKLDVDKIAYTLAVYGGCALSHDSKNGIVFHDLDSVFIKLPLAASKK